MFLYVSAAKTPDGCQRQRAQAFHWIPPPPFVPQRLQRGRSPAKHPCRMMCHLRPADALLPHTALSSGACPLKSVYSEGRRKVAIGLSGVDMLSIYRRLFSAGKGRVSINQSRSLRLLLPNTCYAKSSLDGGGDL